MNNAIAQALAAARALRASPGYGSLNPHERSRLDRDLARIEAALSGKAAPAYGSPFADPYALPMETPADLGGIGPPGRARTSQPAPQPAPAVPAAPPRPPGTEVIGDRARAALEAVDFPAFVAGLITGTFQAIVDATSQQVRDYAKLVADLAQSVDSFSRSNVTPNQVRDWLVGRYPEDLVLALPAPGEQGSPQILPRRRSAGSPTWLADFGLEGEELTAELTEGPLLEAGRNFVGQERMQTLATMVLMGVNRIVVNDGEIKARLQFHASAKESVNADVVGVGVVTQGGIASQQVEATNAVSTKVSTVSINAQADVAVRANLVGEVAIKFRSETFDINQFADTPAIGLINRHSRLKGSGEEAAPVPQVAPSPIATPAPTPVAAPVTAPAPVATPVATPVAAPVATPSPAPAPVQEAP